MTAGGSRRSAPLGGLRLTNRPQQPGGLERHPPPPSGQRGTHRTLSLRAAVRDSGRARRDDQTVRSSTGRGLRQSRSNEPERWRSSPTSGQTTPLPRDEIRGAAVDELRSTMSTHARPSAPSLAASCALPALRRGTGRPAPERDRKRRGRAVFGPLRRRLARARRGAGMRKAGSRAPARLLT